MLRWYTTTLLTYIHSVEYTAAICVHMERMNQDNSKFIQV